MVVPNTEHGFLSNAKHLGQHTLVEKARASR